VLQTQGEIQGVVTIPGVVVRQQPARLERRRVVARLHQRLHLRPQRRLDLRLQNWLRSGDQSQATCRLRPLGLEIGRRSRVQRHGYVTIKHGIKIPLNSSG
jgi:hypothetical protein